MFPEDGATLMAEANAKAQEIVAGARDDGQQLVLEAKDEASAVNRATQLARVAHAEFMAGAKVEHEEAQARLDEVSAEVDMLKQKLS